MTEQELPHDLTLTRRQKLAMTGVTEVVRFEDTLVVLRTELGELMVHGEQLKLQTLSLEGGQMAVEGKINALVYAEPRQSGSWLSRLLG